MPRAAGCLLRVRVNRQEEVRALAVGDGGALFERDELVGAPRQHDLDAGLLLQQFLEAEGDVEHEFGFGDAVGLRARDRVRRGPASITMRETPRPSCRASE